MNKYAGFAAAFVTSAAMSITVSYCHVVPPGVSPTMAPTDQSDCQAACDNIRSLGCPEGNPIDEHTTCRADADCLGPDGKHDPYQTCSPLFTCIVTCTNFCLATENVGVWVDPSCVKGVTACDQINTCPAPVPQVGTSCTGSSCQVAPGAHK